jgi:hypothetical protein
MAANRTLICTPIRTQNHTCRQPLKRRSDPVQDSNQVHLITRPSSYRISLSLLTFSPFKFRRAHSVCHSLERVCVKDLVAVEKDLWQVAHEEEDDDGEEHDRLTVLLAVVGAVPAHRMCTAALDGTESQGSVSLPICLIEILID